MSAMSDERRATIPLIALRSPFLPSVLLCDTSHGRKRPPESRISLLPAIGCDRQPFLHAAFNVARQTEEHHTASGSMRAYMH